MHFVYLYSSLSVLDYSCRAAPKLPGILSTKLYNSMSKVGFWEILVRSCEESFLVKKKRKKKETEIFMHTVSMTRGPLHTASFVLTSCLSSYQTNAFLIEREFLHSQTRALAGRHVSAPCILLREICPVHLEWIDRATNKSRRSVVLMLR